MLNFEFLQYTCIVIALHRALAIRIPLQVERIATPRRAKHVLALIGAFALCLNFPTFFEIEYDPEFGLRQRAFRLHEAYQLWYKNVIHLALLYVIPFALLLSMNSILLYHLRNMMEAANLSVHCNGGSPRISRHRRYFSSNQVTLVTFCIVLAFLCTNLLIVFNNIAEAAAKFGMKDSRTFSILIYIGNLLVIINSATNLLIYCAAGRRFRHTFAEKILKLTMTTTSTPENLKLLRLRPSNKQNITL